MAKVRVEVRARANPNKARVAVAKGSRRLVRRRARARARARIRPRAWDRLALAKQEGQALLTWAGSAGRLARPLGTGTYLK